MNKQITHKEAENILVTYLKKSSNIDEIYIALANCLLDIMKMYEIHQQCVYMCEEKETKKNYIKFYRRMIFNVKEITEVLSGKTKDSFYIKIFSEESEEKV